ncbi:MAG: hypothetical protein MUF42_06035 [Cytophagaceae bacterium]|jgi:hypothetical protein|nr:hypothetical protein [Cytophagaceae bacterium]
MTFSIKTPPAYWMYLLLLLCLFLVKEMEAQVSRFQGAIGAEDWTRGWTEYKPNACSYPLQNQVLEGYIDQDMLLTSRNTYLLQGVVYVINGATLRIEPGTVIRGDSRTCGTLVITRGCKLYAVGTEKSPIVFTSDKSPGERKQGDWGGILMLGNAPVNRLGNMATLDLGLEPVHAIYGGNLTQETNGQLSFVRIEFSGNKISKDKEMNGLTLAGIGKGTILENIQISYSNDDSFEFFGGVVACKNLISFKCTDDDFDFNMGAEVKMHQVLSIRHPLIMDYSGSKCMEIDSYSGDKSSMDPLGKRTQVSISQATFIMLTDGRRYTKEAIQLGSEVNFSLSHSILSGYGIGLRMKDDLALSKVIKNDIRVLNTLFNECDILAEHTDKQAEINQYLLNQNFKNFKTDYLLTELFSNPIHPVFPEFRLKSSQLAETK